MTKKILHNKILIALIITIVILRSGVALQTIFSSLQYSIILSAAIFLFPVLTMFNNPKEWRSGHVVFILIALMTVLTMLIRSEESTGFYILFGCTVLSAFGISSTYSFKKMVSLFLDIMTGLTIIALIGYIFVNHTTLLSNLKIYTNLNEIQYAFLGFFNYIPQIPDRNCGIFWEPGIFATFLVFGIIFEVVFKEGKPNVFRIILFSVGVFTAHSSAGYIIWILSMLLWGMSYIQNKMNEKLAKWVLIGFGVFAGLLLLCMDFIISHTKLAENPYFQKLLFENLFSSLRAKSILHNLKVFMVSPFFGNGIETVTERIVYQADTSTSTYILSVFGVLGIVYTLIWIYGIFKIKNLNIISRMILLMIILFIINKEPHLFNLFSWLFMFYLLKNADEPNKEKNAINIPLYSQLN